MALFSQSHIMYTNKDSSNHYGCWHSEYQITSQNLIIRRIFTTTTSTRHYLDPEIHKLLYIVVNKTFGNPKFAIMLLTIYILPSLPFLCCCFKNIVWTSYFDWSSHTAAAINFLRNIISAGSIPSVNCIQYVCIIVNFAYARVLFWAYLFAAALFS